MAARTVVLAVNPDVMPAVQQILREGAMRLNGPVGGDGERVRIYEFGGRYVMPPVLPEDSPEAVAQRIRMTPRMVQTLHMLADGLPVKQIAQRMGVAHASAKTHTRRLYRFLGVNSAPAAVAEGFRLGLLTGGES
jgi:DNA-binding CsgD family transcriptional regulator